MQAASQGREAEQTRAFTLSAQHCQLRDYLINIFFVFSYPTLCLQPAQPDEFSCLGHPDRTIHTASSTTRPPCPPTNSNGEIKSFQSATTTWVFHAPKTTPASLFFSSELGTSYLQHLACFTRSSSGSSRALLSYQPLGELLPCPNTTGASV